MNKIEELKTAINYADKRDMVYECVDVLRGALPALIEAVETLQAIRARINGEYDNPALMKKGLLSSDTRGDIEHWCDVAIANLENQG